MRPRFQADENLNCKIVAGFRRREPSAEFYDAQQGGLLGLNDPEVLDSVARTGRILVSHDRRTMPRHFAQFTELNASAGLIVIGQKVDIGTAIDELLLIWATSKAEEWHGKIGFVPL